MARNRRRTIDGTGRGIPHNTPGPYRKCSTYRKPAQDCSTVPSREIRDSSPASPSDRRGADLFPPCYTPPSGGIGYLAPAAPGCKVHQAPDLAWSTTLSRVFATLSQPLHIPAAYGGFWRGTTDADTPGTSWPE